MTFKRNWFFNSHYISEGIMCQLPFPNDFLFNINLILFGQKIRKYFDNRPNYTSELTKPRNGSTKLINDSNNLVLSLTNS